MKYIVVFVFMFAVLVLLSMTIYSMVHSHQPLPEPEVTCHAFHVAFPSDMGDFVYFGQSELCGENLEWSTIRRPIGIEKPDGEQQSILR